VIQKIYNLTCEDATHLGGPMGTEYTTHMWTKPFSSIDKSREYAENYVKDKQGKIVYKPDKNWLSWDAGTYCFNIKEQVVK